MFRTRKTLGRLAFAALLTMPAFASAHEMYVLSSGTIATDLATTSPNPFLAVLTSPGQFLFWAFLALVVISTVFFISISDRLENALAPFLQRAKPNAEPVARLTLGIGLVASAFHLSLFGPELPLVVFGPYAEVLALALFASGALILLGIFTRFAALIGLAVFLCGALQFGAYMFNYSGYAGAFLFAFVLGGGRFSLGGWDLPLGQWASRLKPYAFPILRISFGMGIIFAAFYAKFLHSSLALDTVLQYRLIDYFHFDPLFIVLGAFLVEMLIGLFFVFGFQIRHTALFFLFWLVLSLLYFGEAVWPHALLFGVNIALILHGYDRYSIGGLFKRGGREPVL